MQSNGSGMTFITSHVSQVLHTVITALATVQALLIYYHDPMTAGAIAIIMGGISAYGVVASRPTTLSSSTAISAVK